jgi:hypothetical protein
MAGMSEPARAQSGFASLHKLAERYGPPPARGRWHCVHCWWDKARDLLRRALFCTDHR